MTENITAQEGLLLATLHEDGFLNGLDPHYIHKLAGLALEAQFDPGQIIFHEGDERSLLYVICSGTVALKSERETNALQVLHAGDVLGWSALLEKSHRHFEARCMSPVQALAFEGPELLRTFESDPRLGYAFMKRVLSVLERRLEAARRPAPAAAKEHRCHGTGGCPPCG